MYLIETRLAIQCLAVEFWGVDGEWFHLMTQDTMHCALQVPRGLEVRAAMFDGLSSGLEKAWDLVRKDGKLTKDNVKGPMREIRRALLEADVSPLKPKANPLRVPSIFSAGGEYTCCSVGRGVLISSPALLACLLIKTALFDARFSRLILACSSAPVVGINAWDR